MVECWVICLAGILVTHQMDPEQLIMSLYRSVLDQILYFTVSNFILILSDTHCKLEWELLANYKQENISNDNILHPMSPNYMG